MHSRPEGAEPVLSCVLKKGANWTRVSNQSQHMSWSRKIIFTHKEQRNSNTGGKKTFHVKYYATRIQLHTFGHILLTLTGRVNKRNCVVSESNF